MRYTDDFGGRNSRRPNMLKLKTKTTRAVVLLVVLSFVYVFLSTFESSYYTNTPWNPVKKCLNTKEEIQQLVNLTFRAHRLLDEMQIKHWLMYGSIFGARRIQEPLPWDNDADIGFDGNGRFSEITFEELFNRFKREGLKLHNKWIQSGSFVVSHNGWPLTVDLFAFYDHSGLMKRTGLESWLWFINHRIYHTFPTWVAKGALPTVRFGFFNISIPRGGDEILKYLYRFNWWKEVRPKGC